MKMNLTPEKIKEVAPSVFATSPSPKMSDRYVFVPTIDLMENFEREGWELSSVRQSGKGIHAVHEIKFRNGELPKVGDTLVEAIIRNSHNGMSALSISAGLFRLACSNGLTIPTSLSEQFNLRHQKFDLDEVKRLTEDFSKRLPKIDSTVGRMMEVEMTTEEKMEFVRQSAQIRFNNDKVLNKMEIEGILRPNRVEDNRDDLWTTFNVVQEKFIRGGVDYQTLKGRNTKLRSLNDIMTTNRVNVKLWELAEQFI